MAQFYRKLLLRADRLHSNCLIYPINLETCKVHNLPQPFEVSNRHLFVIFSANTGKIASFTVKRSFSRSHSMSRDCMSKDGQKMSPMHVTLKAGVKWCRVKVLFPCNTSSRTPRVADEPWPQLLCPLSS